MYLQAWNASLTPLVDGVPKRKREDVYELGLNEDIVGVVKVVVKGRYRFTLRESPPELGDGGADKRDG